MGNKGVSHQKIGIITASAIVVANMVGTGVFTSLGFQLEVVQETWSILLLWTLGAVIALCGAFAYAELGTAYPQSGGDFIYLSRLFHPFLGYLSAWAGLTVGFSAPVALAAMAMTRYLSPWTGTASPFFAASVILLLTLVHSVSVRQSSAMHNLLTAFKIIFIVTLIGLGLFFPPVSNNAQSFQGNWWKEIPTAGFAVSMVFVSFAYTGWNATAYIAGEVRQCQRNLPRSLVYSTLFVALIYVLLQLVILRNGSLTEYQGREEVTYIAFRNMLGEGGGTWVSIGIALQLLATISAYLWIGPRVTQAMAKEFRLWRRLSGQNKSGIPQAALWLHSLLAIALTLTGSFEAVLLYAGFVLQLMSSLTVAASLFIPKHQAGDFVTPLKPLPQVLFLAFNAWILGYMLVDRPLESLAGVGIIALGAIFYAFDQFIGRQKEPDTDV